MATNKNTDDLYDIDEIDELPDVVLGEKTRAMRAIREGEHVKKTKQAAKPISTTSITNKKLDKINVFEQTTGLPSVDDLLKEDISLETERAEEVSSNLSRTDKYRALRETSSIAPQNITNKPLAESSEIGEIDEKEQSKIQTETETNLDLDAIKQQKYKVGTRLNYLGNEVEIEDYNAKTKRYKIFDSGRIKWVTEKNFTLIDPEIPESLQDEDPGIKDELADVTLENKTQENSANDNAVEESVSVNALTNELNEIYNEKVFKEEANQDVQAEEGNVENNSSKESTTSQSTVDPGLLKANQTFDPLSITANTFSEERKLTFLEDKNNNTRSHKTPMKQKIITGIILLLLIVLGIGIYTIYSGTTPVSSTSEEVAFEVLEGSTARDVANQLEEEGIIKNADVAYTYARIFNLTDIKQGLFTLDKSWDIKQMWTYLNDQNAAKKDETLVTIIEGDWAKDAASKFAEVTNVSSDELLALWNNKEWIITQKDKYPFITDEMFNDGVRIYLEGYLAPNTYYVPRETTAEEITTILLDQTLSVYEKYADDITSSSHSIAEIYTMASIIQYEAGTNPDDLAKVASVFYNRLELGMPLQSSVTVCYAIDFDKLEDNWQSCEINSEFESPYNTYKYTGLTPGPIENAGEAALEAAIHPADTNYLYFMAEVCDGQDGTVHYAETLDEHNANVSQYLTCY